MATTKRTAQIQIVVEDKSIRALNDEIKALEREMQALKVGTTEWLRANERLGDLKRNFNDAKIAAAGLQGQIKQIGTPQQIKAITELGKGMVGAFAGTQAALGLLGVTGDEEFAKITARATQFLVVMRGLDDIQKVFRKGTLDALRAVGGGFNRLVLQVRAASLAMRSALLATGIGALVVGVGLLIANWEKLTNLLNRTDAKAAKALEEAVKQQQQQLTIAEGRLALAEENLKIWEREAELTGDAAQLNREVLNVEKERAKALKERLDLVNEEINLLNEEIRQNEGARRGKKLEAQEERKAKLLELQIERDILQQKRSTLDIQVQQAEFNVRNLDIQEKTEKAIKASEDRLIRLNAEQFSTNEIYREQLNIIEQQIKAITELEARGEKLTKTQRERLDTLRAERHALDLTNKSFNERVLNESILLNSERERNKQIAEYNQKVFELRDALRDQERIERQRNSILSNNQRLLEIDIRGLRDARDLRDSIVNFDREGNRLYKERINSLIPSENSLQKENSDELEKQFNLTVAAYNEIQRFLSVFENEKEYESFEFFRETLEEYVKLSKEAVLEALGIEKEYEKLSLRNRKLIQDVSEDLALQRIESELITKSLRDQEKSLENQKEILNQNIDQYNITLANLEEEEEILNTYLKLREEELEKLKEKKASEEEINAKVEEVLTIENTLVQVISERNQILDECKNTEDIIFEINEDLLEVKLKITNEDEKVNDLLKEHTFNLKDLLRIHQQLQDFVEKYKDEIGASMDLLNSGVFLATTLIDAEAQRMDKRIDDLRQRLQDLDQEENDRQNKLLGYERELEDANGERYNELLRLMDEERNQANQAALEKQRAEQELLKAENKRLELERKSAVWRKSQAIVDATIQTILATIEALPNLLLSGLVATAGAVGVAAIASQPLPPKPKAKTGLLVGSRHSGGGVDINAEEGEFILNRYATAKYYPIVKAMNDDGRRRMAEGGGIGDTPDLNAGQSELINYDLLASKIAEANAALPSPSVNILRVDSELNNIRVTKQRSGLRR